MNLKYEFESELVRKRDINMPLKPDNEIEKLTPI